MKAADDDLVIMDWMALFSGQRGGGREERTEEQIEEFRVGYNYLRTAMAYHKVGILVAPDVPEGTARSYFDRGWPLFEFSQCAFTSRIINQNHILVKHFMTPEWVSNFEANLLKADAMGKARNLPLFADLRDLPFVVMKRQKIAAAMLKASCDAVGFQVTCHAAKFRWVYVGSTRAHYAKQNVEQIGGTNTTRCAFV